MILDGQKLNIKDTRYKILQLTIFSFDIVLA